MAERRIYELVVIIDPKISEEDLSKLPGTIQQIVEKQGGTIAKSEDMGVRRLAYEIGRFTEGHYWFFEIEGSGSEIAELERRMRVSDLVVRYLTVRVDLDRRRAEKFKNKRARRASNRSGRGSRNTAPANAQPGFATEEEAATV